jgi:hypothetical protein
MRMFESNWEYVTTMHLTCTLSYKFKAQWVKNKNQTCQNEKFLSLMPQQMNFVTFTIFIWFIIKSNASKNIASDTTFFIHKKILTWIALYNAFLFIPFEKTKTPN